MSTSNQLHRKIEKDTKNNRFDENLSFGTEYFTRLMKLFGGIKTNILKKWENTIRKKNTFLWKPNSYFTITQAKNGESVATRRVEKAKCRQILLVQPAQNTNEAARRKRRKDPIAMLPPKRKSDHMLPLLKRGNLVFLSGSCFGFWFVGSF